MGLFDALFGKAEKPVTDPDRLRDELFAAARAGDARRLERLARTNQAAVLANFRSWQRVLEASLPRCGHSEREPGCRVRRSGAPSSSWSLGVRTMTADTPVPATAGSSSGRPFAVVLLLTLRVWASALIPRDWFPSDARPFHVATGSAPDLAGAVRYAPRAVVFVDEPTSTYSAAGRIKFPEDARGLARERGALGVRFDAATRGRIPQPRNSPGSMGLVRFGS